MTVYAMQFSIVIPTYNRPKRLQQCLSSLTELSYPRDRFEVVVVDDGSQSSLASVAAPFKTALNLVFIRQSNSGPASARNTGAAAAQGNYLVFTDDDCQPTYTWLTALETALQEAPAALVGGRTLNALPHNLCSTASQVLIDYLYGFYNPDPSTATFFASNNFAVPRAAYLDLQGFDTSFPLAAGEDREFCDRWRYYQHPMSYSPEMQVRHAHQLTLRSFWRQHFNYGRGAFCFHQVRAHRTEDTIKVEALSFYWNLLTYPLRHLPLKQAGPVSVLMLVSQVANVAGFFWEKAQQRQGKPSGTHDTAPKGMQT
ncbi:MAG: glycosyltransferase [Leptolyngbya sp. SIOISBB]|nr:glycosyltransferase [Leptolyngbya sp. SIOISBB]